MSCQLPERWRSHPVQIDTLGSGVLVFHSDCNRSSMEDLSKAIALVGVVTAFDAFTGNHSQTAIPE